MGKAAGALHNYVNEEFLLQSNIDNDSGADVVASEMNQNSNNNTTATVAPVNDSQWEMMLEQSQAVGYKNDKFVTNVYKEWTDGSNISFFVPAQTQTKIFTPDISDFRSEEEKLLSDTGRGFWKSFLSQLGIEMEDGYGRDLDSVITTSKGNVIEYTVRNKIISSIDVLSAGRNSEVFQQKAYDVLVESFIAQNQAYIGTDSKKFLRNFKDDSNAPAERWTWKLGNIQFEDFTLLEAKVKLLFHIFKY